jgi:hypothetical protein
MKVFAGIILAVLVMASANVTPSSAAATSTPMPGGSYQLIGLNGMMSSTLFNGSIRIKKMSFRTATPKEMTVQSGESAIVFSCIVSNGTNERRTGYLAASLVDADGVVLDSYGGDPEESDYTLEPGAAARQSFRFTLKDGFKPVKLFLIERANGTQPVFRVTVHPGDLPQ